MTCKALVIEEDPKVIEAVTEVLESLEHVGEVVHSQADAIKHLKGDEYAYVLCAIRIRARTGNGQARIQNTENLLEKMSTLPDRHLPPVVIMSDHGVGGHEEAVELMRLAISMSHRGVVDVIAKPFPGEGRTLDRVIKKVLKKHRRTRLNAKVTTQPEPITPFKGGVLAYHPRHIELCGETIAEDSRRGYAWQILQVLREANDRGKPVHLGSRALARKLKPPPEQNTVIRAVCSLRSRLAKIVRSRLGHDCGQEDVIANDEQGYHLAGGIVVEVYDEGGTLLGQVEAKGNNATAPRPALKLDNKHRWVMARLASEGKLIRREVEQQFGISDRTAKRVLGELSEAGLIEFDRTTHPGFYRLK